jgi:hypothetical protein
MTIIPKEVHTRFLYPFFFGQDKVADALVLLSNLTHPTRDDAQKHIWVKVDDTHTFYRDDLLEHVESFLFSCPDEKMCRYLRLESALTSQWFNKIVAPFIKGSEEQVTLSPIASIELFLSKYGVGVLSISLTPRSNDLTFNQIVLFNYVLSQLRKYSSISFRIPHPSDNAVKWQNLTHSDRAAILPPPSPTSPLKERLGKNGASFKLEELLQYILWEPLNTLGLRKIQNQFSIYSVVRLGEDIDFDNSHGRESLAPYLLALAQVEEPTHAGAPSDEFGIPNVVLNRKHWAAATRLGSVHFVADQSAEHDFNSERVPRILMKYFIPYLIALLQRTTLHRIADESARIILSPKTESEAHLSQLRNTLLEFSAESCFTEISYRESVHRYYNAVREAFDITKLLQGARNAIIDIDAKNISDRHLDLAKAANANAAETMKLQERMTQQMEITAGIQIKIEWIEIFVVGFYSSELTHIIFEIVEKDYVVELWYHVSAVLVVGLIAGIVTWLILKPSQH